MSMNSLLSTKHTLHYLNFRNTSCYSIITILHREKLSPREVQQVAQNHIYSGQSTSKIKSLVYTLEKTEL